MKNTDYAIQAPMEIIVITNELKAVEQLMAKVIENPSGYCINHTLSEVLDMLNPRRDRLLKELDNKTKELKSKGLYKHPAMRLMASQAKE